MESAATQAFVNMPSQDVGHSFCPQQMSILALNRQANSGQNVFFTIWLMFFIYSTPHYMDSFHKATWVQVSRLQAQLTLVRKRHA